jgi:hypothetical protein
VLAVPELVTYATCVFVCEIVTLPPCSVFMYRVKTSGDPLTAKFIEYCGVPPFEFLTLIKSIKSV